MLLPQLFYNCKARRILVLEGGREALETVITMCWRRHDLKGKSRKRVKTDPLWKMTTVCTVRVLPTTRAGEVSFKQGNSHIEDWRWSLPYT
jgi:hypothetical protein